MRNPSFCMEDRLLLDKIDYETQSITIGGVTYALEDCDFPTVDRNDPYRLTEEEQEIVSELKTSFAHSPRLRSTWNSSTGWGRCTCASTKTCSTTVVCP